MKCLTSKQPKMCLVEVDNRGDPVRIFKYNKTARQYPVEQVAEWVFADAVHFIREKLYQRSKVNGSSFCEWGCGRPLTRLSGHMHEVLARGKRDQEGNYGEISILNSVFICYDCHINGAHGDRKWHTARLEEE